MITSTMDFESLLSTETSIMKIMKGIENSYLDRKGHVKSCSILERINIKEMVEIGIKSRGIDLPNKKINQKLDTVLKKNSFWDYGPFNIFYSLIGS